MRILIAPNSFKKSLGAAEAADAIARGLNQSRLACLCRCHPIADGGDGTAAVLLGQFDGVTETVAAHHALGGKISADVGYIHKGRTAVVELAEASGLRRLARSRLDPLRASTFGTGELIRSALDRGAGSILLAAGGSATIDGAAGALRALGVRLLDGHGSPLSGTAESLARVAAIDLSGLHPRARECAITVLCDVENPMLGSTGAARIFGTQKGARGADIQALEAALARWVEVLRIQTGIDVGSLPRGGAAGGVAAGLHAVLGASLVSGTDRVLDVTGFDGALDQTDLLITGEGALDRQTLRGKAPLGAALRARARGVPVIALAGHVPAAADADLHAAFDAMLSISHAPIAAGEALKLTALNLQRTARALGDILAMAGGRSSYAGAIEGSR
ncbi:MAG TPA: glycerate kinase [Rhizomicrobium sp.]|jgi:glycerate kinase